ncbi:phytoene dehydrogenase [Diplodia corticola]|uniref:Bifunctional lycopene cyclase/phytoene synthase n=1 Tax=Diplodia corticola TaxID=236234 RepID=A0A1J9SA36_9PEZI|nr:phytoene dehydrogenase [Diplodia corticola]OJD37351.1 phytoene dehydrogenase [Diplodia corticola]
MGYDYALVHLKYTIPPAVALTFLYRPLLTRLDVYKILFLVTIAVVSTIPWDSYLIRTRVWTYPATVIVGPKLLGIPAEEVFFFVIQTYNTSLLYLLLGKPVFFPIYLRTEQVHLKAPAGKRPSWKRYQWAGQTVLASGIGLGAYAVKTGGRGTYMGLIILWAFPFLFLLWSLAYQCILGIPRSSSLWPIAVPTVYLWVVDTLALRRGTWVIETGTKLGFHLWPGLEIEEAFFFLTTNTLIVFGLIAFDNALAILFTCRQTFPTIPPLPSPALLVRALLKPASSYDESYLHALGEAVGRLRRKSRSFYIASGTFQGRLRADLILLYSFCRVADDLVDNAADSKEAREWIRKLRMYLDLSYMDVEEKALLQDYIEIKFPAEAQSALGFLPTSRLSSKPLYDMLDGFEMDVAFASAGDETSKYPIQTVSDLDLYGERVAGTVAHSILELVFHNLPSDASTETKERLIKAGSRMGVALQYVNISRDIAVDARIQRVYIPLDWIAEQELTPVAIIKNPQGTRVEDLRLQLLNRAFHIYADAKDAIEELPDEARGPMRVAVESYMEIGRVIKEEGYRNNAIRPNNCLLKLPSIEKLSTMAEKVRQRTAVIIGAGVGGVATAARLAKAGYAVTVVEKNDFTGGRCSLIHHDGYRFDQGPSLLLLPNLFAEAFQDLGTSLEAEGVHLIKCEPNYRLWFGDGHSFELSTDLARMKKEVEKWEGKDGFERYLAFLAEAHRHYELSVTHVLKRNFTTLLSMARPSFLKHLIELHPFESIYSRASKYFWTERLRRAFTFASMYMGMSPFEAPGTYSLLQYTELAEGVWYPEGGFHKVIEALVKVGERLGVTYRLSTPVSSIALSPDHRRATGVVLASGETIPADVVVNNSDLVYAYNNLLPPTAYARSLAKRPASCSSISFYWSLSRAVPELGPHNIFLADEYRASFDSIFKHHQIPAEPSFYLNVPSRIDPAAAPPGKDAVVVLVPVGHLTPEPDATTTTTTTTTTDTAASTPPQDWPAMLSRARAAVLAAVRARTGADLAPLIAHERVNAPPDWRAAFNLDRGAILGLGHSFFNVLSFRPGTRHPRARGLYFVGASTHPGTGVPICLAGSRVTAEQVLGDEGDGWGAREGRGAVVPWGRSGGDGGGGVVGGGGSKGARGGEGIDRVEGGGGGYVWWLLQVAVLLLAVLGAFALAAGGGEGGLSSGSSSSSSSSDDSSGSWLKLGKDW